MADLVFLLEFLNLQRLFISAVFVVIILLLTISLYLAVLHPVVNVPETGNPREAADESNNYFPNLPIPIQETQPVGTHPSHFYQLKIKKMKEQLENRQWPKRGNHEEKQACQNASCSDFRHSAQTNQKTKQGESEDQQLSVQPRRRRTSSENSSVPDDVDVSDPTALSFISEDDAVFPEESMDDEERRLLSSDFNGDGENGDTTSEKPKSSEGVNDSDGENDQAATPPRNEKRTDQAEYQNQETKQGESEDQQLSVQPRRRRTSNENSSVPDDVDVSDPMEHGLAAADKSPPRDHPEVATDESHHNSTVAHSNDHERKKNASDGKKINCESSGEEEKT